jgi:hypothetical protein
MSIFFSRHRQQQAFAYEVSPELRRKVASKHRQVLPMGPIVNPIDETRMENGGNKNIQIADFDGGEYEKAQPAQPAYLNPPVLYRYTNLGIICITS